MLNSLILLITYENHSLYNKSDTINTNRSVEQHLHLVSFHDRILIIDENMKFFSLYVHQAIQMIQVSNMTILFS